MKDGRACNNNNLWPRLLAERRDRIYSGGKYAGQGFQGCIPCGFGTAALRFHACVAISQRARSYLCACLRSIPFHSAFDAPPAPPRPTPPRVCVAQNRPWQGARAAGGGGTVLLPLIYYRVPADKCPFIFPCARCEVVDRGHVATFCACQLCREEMAFSWVTPPSWDYE